MASLSTSETPRSRPTLRRERCLEPGGIGRRSALELPLVGRANLAIARSRAAIRAERSIVPLDGVAMRPAIDGS